MSKISTLFRKYVWIVDTIRRERRITLTELSNRWMHTNFSEGAPLSRSTFNRYRNEVEEIFGITIACDADNKYYIVDQNILHNDSVQEWMLNTLTVSNIVGEAKGLHDRILLENVPTEGEYLQQVVEAMRRGVRIFVRYCRYSMKEVKEWVVDPYCIKLFRRRWYLLCDNGKGCMVLSLDRILELTLTDEPFTIDPAFDAEAFFSEYYGVMTDPRIPLTRIILRAYGNERYSMRDLPLHHSQQLLEESDDYFDFELYLRPTSDFLAQILSRGKWVEVISPDDMANKISELHREAIK